MSSGPTAVAQSSFSVFVLLDFLNLRRADHWGPPFDDHGGKQYAINISPNHELESLQSTPRALVRLQEETEFLCLFSVFVFGRDAMDYARSYCPWDAQTIKHRRSELNWIVVNPRHNLSNNTAYCIFPARPFPLSLVRHGYAEFLCFCFLFCFFTLRNHHPCKRDADLCQDGPWLETTGNVATRWWLTERQLKHELAVN